MGGQKFVTSMAAAGGVWGGGNIQPGGQKFKKKI